VNVRRSIASAAVLLTVPALSACGVSFGAQTDQVYNPSVGVDDRSGAVDVLNALVVSGANGSGTVVALSLRGGQVFPLDGRSRTVLPRRFFLGGATTMRGYAEEEMIPQDVRGVLAAEARLCAVSLSGVGCTERGRRIASGERPVSEGGEAFVLAKAELRLRLRGSLEAGVFADLGNVWLDPREYRLLDLRANAGLGLRFVTPIGPAVVDVGFNVDPDRAINERSMAAHFTIGLF